MRIKWKLGWHLPTILFSCKTTYKITIRYTLHQLVYGSHLLMPIKYILPIIDIDHKERNHVRVLTSKVLELEKLQVDKLAL